MINKVYQTEIKYMTAFCNTETLEHGIRFVDDKIKDMYSHNYVYIHHDVSEEDIIKTIKTEMVNRKAGHHRYLRVVTSANISETLFSQLSNKPDIDKSYFMGIKSNQHTHFKTKEKAKVLKADNDQIFEDGRMVDIVANYIQMTLEFAVRRIDRKIEAYKDTCNHLDFYVCYDDIEPVGNCELLKNNEIAKIEDFDVIEMHQRKGYGSFVLKSILKVCQDDGIDYAYLVTDQDDTAKEMYIKSGLEIIGESTEMMFHL